MMPCPTFATKQFTQVTTRGLQTAKRDRAFSDRIARKLLELQLNSRLVHDVNEHGANLSSMNSITKQYLPTQPTWQLAHKLCMLLILL